MSLNVEFVLTGFLKSDSLKSIAFDIEKDSQYIIKSIKEHVVPEIKTDNGSFFYCIPCSLYAHQPKGIY